MTDSKESYNTASFSHDETYYKYGNAEGESGDLFQLTNTFLETNTTVFYSKNTEMIKLCQNGDIFVKGKLIENDIEVVDAMREFLKMQNIIK